MPGFASTAFFSFSMVAPSTPSVWRMTDIGSLKKLGLYAAVAMQKGFDHLSRFTAKILAKAHQAFRDSDGLASLQH
jgi:hypothetical protein